MYRLEASMVSNGGWFLVSKGNVLAAIERMYDQLLSEGKYPYLRII